MPVGQWLRIRHHMLLAPRPPMHERRFSRAAQLETAGKGDGGKARSLGARLMAKDKERREGRREEDGETSLDRMQ